MVSLHERRTPSSTMRRVARDFMVFIARSGGPSALTTTWMWFSPTCKACRGVASILTNLLHRRTYCLLSSSIELHRWVFQTRPGIGSPLGTGGLQWCPRHIMSLTTHCPALVSRHPCAVTSERYQIRKRQSEELVLSLRNHCTASPHSVVPSKAHPNRTASDQLSSHLHPPSAQIQQQKTDTLVDSISRARWCPLPRGTTEFGCGVVPPL